MTRGFSASERVLFWGFFFLFFLRSRRTQRVPEHECENQTENRRMERMRWSTKRGMTDGRAAIWHVVQIKGAVCDFSLDFYKEQIPPSRKTAFWNVAMQLISLVFFFYCQFNKFFLAQKSNRFQPKVPVRANCKCNSRHKQETTPKTTNCSFKR